MTPERELPILVVSPDTAEAAQVQRLLLEAGYSNTHSVNSGREAARLMGLPIAGADDASAKQQGRSFALLVLSDGLSDLPTAKLCELAKSHVSAFLPVLLIGKPEEMDARVGWIDVGIDDFLERPVGGEELLARCMLHLRKQQHLQAVTDTTERLQVASLRRRPRLPGVGDRINDYAVDEALSATASTQVFRVHHLESGTPLVLKLLVTGADDDRSLRLRFQREAEMVKGVDHPNVIRVIDNGEVSERPYIVMEYVDGADLAVLLRQSQKFLPFELIISIAEELALALKAVHDIGIIHRDIKPRNIFRTREGMIKLADFGISAQIADTRLTEVGLAVGTPLYMAPEQVEHSELAPTADIYSYGATLYHMITKQPPFPGKNAMKVIRQHLYDTPPPLRSRRADIDAAWDQFVCERCMAKAPDDRPQDMDEVLATVAELRQHPF